MQEYITNFMILYKYTPLKHLKLHSELNEKSYSKLCSYTAQQNAFIKENISKLLELLNKKNNIDGKKKTFCVIQIFDYHISWCQKDIFLEISSYTWSGASYIFRDSL